MNRRAASTGGCRARGFTLVEVMVALMIMSVIAVMAWQGVDGIVRTRSASQARLERTLRLNAVLGQLEYDLQALQETPTVPGFTFDGATLRITRRAETGIQVVTWSLRPDADAASHTWMRWASPPARTSSELQDTWFLTQQFQGVEPGHMRTLGGIARWQVYCYRGNSWSNCQSSANTTVVQAGSATAGGAAATAGAPAAAAPASGEGTGGAGTTGGAGAAAGGTTGGAAAATVVTRQVLPTGLRLVLEFDGGDIAGTLTRDIALGP